MKRSISEYELHYFKYKLQDCRIQSTILTNKNHMIFEELHDY